MSWTGLLSITGALVLLATAGGCADDDTGDTQSHPGALSQGVNLDDAPRCDVDTPCPEGSGLECVVIRAETTIGPLCLDAETACDVLDCGGDDCLLLESYPAQLACAGPPSGDGDGDGPVSSEPDGE